MHYEINVSLNGTHYFATASHSLVSEDQAHDLEEHFERVFPESEGYEVRLYRVETTRKRV